MFGLILITLATFCDEVTSSIGKFKVAKGEESIYTMGFLNLFWGVVLFGVLILFKRDLFVFSWASWPTFGPRLLLEILQLYFTVQALTKADRSTYSFLRLATIPLLLLSDLAIGYALSPRQIAGILVLALVLAVVFDGKRINKTGAVWVMLSAVNAVATISLYKYDITNFNSVAAEQFLVMLTLLLSFYLFALFKTKENPWRFLWKKIFFVQSFSQGVGTMLESFAYNFIPASVAVAIKRSTSLLWSVFSGRIYFKEEHLWYKIVLFVFSFMGLILLAK